MVGLKRRKRGTNLVVRKLPRLNASTNASSTTSKQVTKAPKPSPTKLPTKRKRKPLFGSSERTKISKTNKSSSPTGKQTVEPLKPSPISRKSSAPAKLPAKRNQNPAPNSTGVKPVSKKFKRPRFNAPKLVQSKMKSEGNTVASRKYPGSADKKNVVPKYFTVMYCKASRKKHKTYQDGVLIVKGSTYNLKNMEGKDVGRPTQLFNMSSNLGEGSEFYFGGQEVEISAPLDVESYESGRIFVSGTEGPVTAPKPRMKQKKFKRPVQLAGKGVLRSPSGEVLSKKKILTPRHSPNAPDALILNEEPWKEKLDKVAVVVDPFLSTQLRPHQREGIKFMYQCVMGIKNPGNHGMILGDEMGLGKTLQSIVLSWVLLKDGPSAKPEIKKVLIVTPSTLVKNWSQEFRKWLGSQRTKPIALMAEGKAKQKEKISTFVKGTQFPILIVSYELYTKNYEAISSANIGLLICDEGHRLKNASGNITINSLKAIRCSKRVILTGTPVQNNLEELYAMCDFVNPAILGSLSTFKNIYANPVQKSRCTQSTKAEKRLGDQRGEELARKTTSFILRRTKDVLKKFLPPKLELVVFCRMSAFQIAVYNRFLKSDLVSGIFSSSYKPAGALECLQALSRLSNHPSLVYKKCQQLEEEGSSKLMDAFPPNYDPEVINAEDSGKLHCLSELLAQIKSTTKNRVVIVSSYTQTLNIIQKFCVNKKYQFLRLDGSTNSEKRISIVNRFNAPYCKTFVFLLSAKAGGVGLNLIGANRLILFDPHWNPAVDQQVMARIWRDGQKNPCFVYRLLSVGTIDERIFQRQITKQEMASVVDERKTDRHFSREELKDLFTLNDNAEYCNTYDLLKGKLGQWDIRMDSSELRDPVQGCVMDKQEVLCPIVFTQFTTSLSDSQENKSSGDKAGDMDKSLTGTSVSSTPKGADSEEDGSDEEDVSDEQDGNDVPNNLDDEEDQDSEQGENEDEEEDVGSVKPKGIENDGAAVKKDEGSGRNSFMGDLSEEGAMQFLDTLENVGQSSTRTRTRTRASARNKQRRARPKDFEDDDDVMNDLDTLDDF